MVKYHRYNSRRVRKFLKAAFPTSSALIELCDECYPDVLYSFSDGMSWRSMVNAIFKRCHNDQALEKLLHSAQEILEDEGKEDIWLAHASRFKKTGSVPTMPIGAESHESKEGKFFKAILEFNYQQEVKIFHDFLEIERPISFLIRGPKEHGQRLLLNQLYQCLPYSTNSKRIERSLDRHGRSRQIKFLWRELGEEVGVGRAGSRHAIARRIDDYLQSQHLIFIFNNAGLTDKGYLSQLMGEFWHPLLDELAHIQPLHPTTHQLIMFIVDYRGQADLEGVDWIETFHAHSTPYAKRPVKLELSGFCEKDVRDWFEHKACRVLPAKSRVKLDIMIKKWFQTQKSGFVPERILEKICHCCDYDWSEGEDKWFKL